MTHEKRISCARYMALHHDMADTSICIRSEASCTYSVGDILRLREWVVVAVKRGAYGLHKGAVAIAHRRIEV